MVHTHIHTHTHNFLTHVILLVCCHHYIVCKILNFITKYFWYAYMHFIIDFSTHELFFYFIERNRKEWDNTAFITCFCRPFLVNFLYVSRKILFEFDKNNSLCDCFVLFLNCWCGYFLIQLAECFPFSSYIRIWLMLKVRHMWNIECWWLKWKLHCVPVDDSRFDWID